MDDVMADLARDTGGVFFHNNNDLDLGLREMASVPDDFLPDRLFAG